MRAVIAALIALLLVPAARAEDVQPTYGLSLFGDPLKYPADFTHFDYVNPDAPKGGFVRFGDIGTFDNLNPFILKGASFIRYSNSMMKTGALYDCLMTGSLDEPLAGYGLVAESMEYPAGRMSITFNMRKEAHFNDGSPITAEDVCWTYQTLLTKGHPSYKLQLADVDKCEVLGPLRVKFTFKDNTDRELPMLVGGLPILPSKWWATRDFEKPTLEPPLGSGPYRITKVDPGRSLTWERVKDYWAKDLPVTRGFNNFDTVRVDYYRDVNVMFEAFKAGQIDLREDLTAKDWATAYDFPAVKDGLVIKDEVHHEVPQGMQGFIFNTRRPIFADRRVRRALGYMFDFEWFNKNYFYNAYTRTKSYFENSDLASRGLPEGEELKILEPYRGKVPDDVFTTEYQPPVYDGSGNIRDGIRSALALLKEAGWSVKSGTLVNDKTGQPFTFEFLNDDARLERIILPFLKNLERIGIKAQLRTVDAAQFENRRRDYDYDMISLRYGASLAPGTELREYFSSKAADQPGSANTSGIKDPVVDALVDQAIAAKTRHDLVPIIHALDRVLLWGYYIIPNWYSGFYHVAYWDKFGKPAVTPKYASMPSSVIDTWWINTAKEKPVAERQEQEKSKQH